MLHSQRRTLNPKPILLLCDVGTKNCKTYFPDFVSRLLSRFRQWEGLRADWKVKRKKDPLSSFPVLSAKDQLRSRLRLPVNLEQQCSVAPAFRLHFQQKGLFLRAPKICLLFCFPFVSPALQVIFASCGYH